MYKQINVLLVNTARYVSGTYGLKMSYNNILRSVNYQNIHILTKTAACKFIHSVVYNNEPPVITDLISFPQTDSNGRQIRIPVRKYKAKLVN